MVVKEFLEDIENQKEREVMLKAWKWTKRGFAGLFAAIGLMTIPYTVPADSEGVVRRFGRHVRTTEPGIHAAWPYWIESVTKVPTKKVQKIEIGFRTLEAGVNSRYLSADAIKDTPNADLSRFVREKGENETNNLPQQAAELLRREYLMLTGDLNMANVEWVVQYKIKDPVAYLFNVRDSEQTIRDCSQAVMRELIGNGSVDEAITIGRINYQNSAGEGLQKLLDDYKTGIHVVAINLQSSNPPKRVQGAFNEVNKAMQYKENRINVAKKEYNTAVPRAKGEAQGLVKKAEGYALERVNRAKGDVGKFDRIYEEYAKAKEITRSRMYLEAMTEFLPQVSEKWIIEQKGADGGILLKLDIDKANAVVREAEK